MTTSSTALQAGVVRRTCAALAFLAALANGTASGQTEATDGRAAAKGRASVRRIRTPDGSVFVLVKRGSRKVAAWASFVRMGLVHEFPGQAGLAEACARASLNGTKEHGSSDPALEARALAELDRAEARYRGAELSGMTGTDLEHLAKARADAHQRAAALGDRLAFRGLLAALPTDGPTIRTMVDGTLLEARVPAERLADFAVLMDSRRRHALLRNFHEELARVRSRRPFWFGWPGANHLREACTQALVVHPARRAMLPRPRRAGFVSRQRALEFYTQHQRPERTVTAIVGDIDIDATAKMLQRVFAHAVVDPLAAAPRLPLEPPQTGGRSTTISATKLRAVLAWRTPRATLPSELEVLARMLADGSGSDLRGRFVEERMLADEVTVRPMFPGRTEPMLFTVELAAPTERKFEQLLRQTRAYFATLHKNGPSKRSVDRAIQVYRAERRRMFDDPKALAADLAIRVGTRADRQWSAPNVTPDNIQRLTKALFDSTRLTRIVSTTGAGNDKGNTK